MAERIDRELEEFRGLMEVPSTFDEGFSWSALIGALFVAILMVPGSIYMGLLAGAGMGGASQWVTVILFLEVAKRAHRTLNKSEIFVLFFMSAAAMGMPFTGLLWNQFYIHSEAAAATGIAEQLPRWFAPQVDSRSYELRTFLHVDWIPVIAMGLFGTFFGELSSMILGYGLFRLASDIEKLPFPMAPVGAQGIMAVAEDVDAKAEEEAEEKWKWRVFSIGGALGLAFGAVYLFLPTLSGALTGTSIQIFPIPFSDFTPKTGQYLHAVATGLTWDLGGLISGMVMPFYSMLGSFLGMLFTCVLNPVLYNLGVLSHWRPTDDTIQTSFVNNIDFYFSYGIGVALAIAGVGFYMVLRSLLKARADAKARGDTQSITWRGGLIPKGRGDIATWIVLLCYVGVTVIYITASALLLRWHHNGQWTREITNVIIALVLLGFVYTPFISYVTARLEGMVGMAVGIPYVNETAILLSGYRGVAVWFLPIPSSNYGGMTVFYRQCELTGTKFTSIWKTQIVLYPIIIVSGILFANFIWSLNPVPSGAYPFAQMMWELRAKTQSIMYTATMGEYSMFEEAFRWKYVGIGAASASVMFGFLSMLKAPVFFIYGLIGGIGGMMHSTIPSFIGALIGRYYFQKRLGLMWRQYIPVVAAGFACGMGLITTVGVGITFISKAVIKLPF